MNPIDAVRNSVLPLLQLRSKLRPIYRDSEVQITENLAPFPRAYVVPTGRQAPEGFTPLSAMLDTTFGTPPYVVSYGGWGRAAVMVDGPRLATILTNQPGVLPRWVMHSQALGLGAFEGVRACGACTSLARRLTATLNCSSITAERGPRSGCVSSRRIGAVTE